MSDSNSKNHKERSRDLGKIDNRESIVTAQGLHLVYQTSFYQDRSVRERFVRFCRNPLASVRSTQDRIYVLSNINLNIKSGDRVGVLGRNGAGKTSLCRCLTGLYKPSSGQLTVRGSVRGIFDVTSGIYPELSGLENIKLLVKFLYPEARPDHKRMVAEVLEFSGLGDFVYLPFKNYSSGMQARLCLSLLTCQPSQLLILDEVFESADQFFREKMSQRMLRLTEESDSVLFVSHSPDQIRRICNRVIVIEGGQIAYDGNVEGGLQFYEDLMPKKH